MFFFNWSHFPFQKYLPSDLLQSSFPSFPSSWLSLMRLYFLTFTQSPLDDLPPTFWSDALWRMCVFSCCHHLSPSMMCVKGRAREWQVSIIKSLNLLFLTWLKPNTDLVFLSFSRICRRDLKTKIASITLSHWLQKPLLDSRIVTFLFVNLHLSEFFWT